MNRNARDLPEGDRLSLADGDAVARFSQLLTGLGPHLRLDLGDDFFCFFLVAVDEQPSRALRHLPANHQNAEADDRSDSEGEAPAHVGREDRLVEEEQPDQTAHPRTHPVAAIDRDVSPAAVARRDQLIYGRVDGRVLTADAHPGEEAKEKEVPRRKGEAVATVASK